MGYGDGGISELGCFRFGNERIEVLIEDEEGRRESKRYDGVGGGEIEEKEGKW